MKETQGGFTIVEVVVVIAVFAIGLGSISALFASIQLTQRNNRYLTAATRAARTEVDKIRSTMFTSITDGTTFTSDLPTTLPAGSTGTVTVSVPTNAPNSKQVDVTVTYPVGTTTKQVTISAYVDPDGGPV